ncbi:putative RiPP precursor [Mesorhizobium sp. SARCC-RB16n]|nr:putative RiPP precursor [Mesorhizobium sp. SARCC-RB16n]
MKKTYAKPTLSKREKLSAVTAIACPVSQPCG